MNAMSSKVERYLAITGQFVLYAVLAAAATGEVTMGRI